MQLDQKSPQSVKENRNKSISSQIGSIRPLLASPKYFHLTKLRRTILTRGDLIPYGSKPLEFAKIPRLS